MKKAGKDAIKGGRCVLCGGGLSFAKSRFQGFPIDAYRCGKCKEEYFDPQQAESVLELNKAMHQVYAVKIGQIQSNLIIRIPVKVGESLNLRKGEVVDLEVENLSELCIRIPERNYLNRTTPEKALVLNEKKLAWKAKKGRLA